MKPEWKDAPEWARYLAMDKDGTWYWYARKPKLSELGVWIAGCDAYWTLAVTVGKPCCERRPK